MYSYDFDSRVTSVSQLAVGCVYSLPTKANIFPLLLFLQNSALKDSVAASPLATLAAFVWMVWSVIPLPAAASRSPSLNPFASRLVATAWVRRTSPTPTTRIPTIRSAAAPAPFAAPGFLPVARRPAFVVTFAAKTRRKAPQHMRSHHYANLCTRSNLG